MEARLALLGGILARIAVAAVPNASGIEVAAFVYDCWTTDDIVWGHHGANWTEWALVKAATPRFAGHLQPKVPLWGYLDTALPATWDILNPAAVEHGVTVYMWDFYWFANMTTPVLANGLNNGFLRSSTRNSVKFALMWANQDWSDIQPAKRNAPQPTQFYGAVDNETFTRMTAYWIQNYLVLPNYYRVPDLKSDSPERVCALVNVYLVSTLIDGLGGLANTAAAVASFRAAAAAAGIPCIHLQVEGFGLKPYGAQIPEIIDALGISSVTDYCWQHYRGMSGFPITDYASYAAASIADYAAQAEAFKPAPYVPNFSVAWDPSTRTVQSDVFDATAVAESGYPFSPALQPTVSEIETALEASAAAIAAACDPAWCLLTVYAYTEFSEGGSLWPTVEDGFGRLEAFQHVFGNRSSVTL